MIDSFFKNKAHPHAMKRSTYKQLIKHYHPVRLLPAIPNIDKKDKHRGDAQVGRDLFEYLKQSKHILLDFEELPI